MYWGIIWKGERSKLIVMEHNEDSSRQGYTARSYQKALRNGFLSHYDRTRYFQQDNAKIHIYKSTEEWLQARGISWIEWPVHPHTPNCKYSPHRRTRIAVGYELGLSRTALWAKGVNPASVSKIVKRYNYQISGKSLPRSGRPRILNDRDIRAILHTIDSDPFISAEKLRQSTGLTGCTRTITRELRRLGIQHQCALRRPKLSDKLAAKRLVFAKLHVQKPKSWWRRLIVSDESSIARGDGERQAWVFCQKVHLQTLRFYTN